MAYTQLQKVGIIFLSIFAFGIMYSLISKNLSEGFEDKPQIKFKTCSKDSDCPSRFACKDEKCVNMRPIP
jgi:hypothetical protein